MRLGYGFAFEDRGDEGGGEAVARPDGIGDFHLRCRLEGDVAGGKDVTAVDAAC